MLGRLRPALSTTQVLAASDFDQTDGGSSMLLVSARICLFLTILISALYLLQRYAFFPFSSGGRFVLIVATLILAILADWRRMLGIPISFLVLGLSVGWAGVHTYMDFGLHLGIAATSRFANVMIIAPLAALLFVSRRSLKVIFVIYLFVFVAAYASLLYQYFGGSLATLVQNYIAIRADLVRYMTIVGEPNVGGMLAVLTYIMGVTIPRTVTVSATLAGIAIAFVIMTLSKGAVLGVCVASLALFLLSPAEKRVGLVLRGVLGGLVGIAFVLLIGADAYLFAAIKSVLGNIKGEPSAMTDFANRQWGFLLDLDFRNAPISSLMTVLFGSSFGVAGSAAQEVLGSESNVILPHNSYVEMIMTGGIAMMGSILYLMVGAFRRLISQAHPNGSPEARCALVCLVMLACWMLIYPVIYEPVTGALLWSLIGYGNRIAAPVLERPERKAV